jgi:FKBP-type peptidyl-prolyl cis-trans isomerase
MRKTFVILVGALLLALGGGDGAAGAAKPAKAAPKTLPAPADVAAPPADAEKTPSGLATKVLQAGPPGERPKPEEQVEVHYTGWTTDGKMFDSSVLAKKPLTFSLSGVIAGFSEGLQLMVPGEKRRLWIPEELAYRGRADRPKGMLVFDVELRKILPAPAPTPVEAPTPP